MPFRERAKNLFKTKSRSDSVSKSSSTTNSDSTNNPNNPKSSRERDCYPSNVYGPDEPMPKPKYRLPPKKEHKEKLEAFNFADAWRKRSFQSSYSPMGTRAPSRRNSFLSRLSRPASRANSVTSDGAAAAATAANGNGNVNGGAGGVGGARRSSSVTSAGASDGNVGAANTAPTSKAALLHPNAALMETQPEAEGDDDITNVGLSRVQSRTKAHPDTSPSAQQASAKQSSTNGQAAATAQQRPPNINGVVPPGVTAHDHQPFSEQELQLAMQRSHMTVTAQS